MQTRWLHRKNQDECLLFMAGWAMGPEPFQQLAHGGMDVLMVYDYRHLAVEELLAVLPVKRHLHLLAWSMGVWVAATCLGEIPFQSATALGGTCRPVHATCGIPGNIFEATLADLSMPVLKGFYQAMFDQPKHCKLFFDNKPTRPLSHLHQELKNIKECVDITPGGDDIFDYHCVTGRDKIFPARNQLRAWGRKNCITRPWPHFPFYNHKSWPELLEHIRHDQ